jgi:LmeA-like phospholipid-binding
VRRVLVSVVILAVLLVIVDRVAVVVAERAVAKQIRAELSLRATPSVSIRGFPFLNQAVTGRYRDVEVRIPSVDSGPLHNMQVTANLHDLRAPLSDMVAGRLDAVPVRDIAGTLAVRYDDLARASGIPGLTIRPSGNGLRVSGTVEVASQRIEASARGTITVADNDLVVTAQDAEVGGVPVPPAALAAAARLLSFRVSPRSLPLALRITGVKEGADSLTVAAQAHDVVLRRGEIPIAR